MIVHYYIYGFNKRDGLQIERILNDQRGWIAQGHSFIRTELPLADVIISKRSTAFMKRTFTSPELYGLSVTTRYSDGTPTQIFINAGNWNNTPKGFDGSKALYHAYVIQHEMGHALGHHHESPTDPAKPCPVMYQQTRGTKGICRSNPWIQDQLL